MELRSTTLPGTQELELRNWNSGTGTQVLELRSRVCLELMGPVVVLPWNSGLGVSRAVSHTLWLSIAHCGRVSNFGVA